MLAQGWSLQGVMVTGLDTVAVTTGGAAWQRLLDGLARGPACLVEVESTQGSAPREPGAWMAVFSAEAGGAGARRRIVNVPDTNRPAFRFASWGRSTWTKPLRVFMSTVGETWRTRALISRPSGLRITTSCPAASPPR
mgnify:CR=1 FL=1